MLSSAFLVARLMSSARFVPSPLDAEPGGGVVAAAIERVPDRRRVAPGIVDVADAALGGEALAEVEAGAERGGGLDGRAAALAAALGEMAVTRREQRALSPDREVDRGAGGHLLGVEIAAVLAGWHGPQRLAVDRGVSRDRALGRGRQRQPAGGDQVVLPCSDASEQVARGRHAHHPHERRTGNFDARYFVADCAAGVLFPLGAERLVEDVAQVTEARKGEGEAVVARDYIEDVDDQQVAGLRVPLCRSGRSGDAPG